MKPILDKEILLNVYYLKQTVIDLPAALLLLRSAADLEDHPKFPFPNMPINMFRAIVGAEAHPDDRGLKMLFDPDEHREGDDQPTPEELLKAWNKLLENNEGLFKAGELHRKYPELTSALNIPNPAVK